LRLGALAGLSAAVRCDASKPAANPRRLASTDFFVCRIACSALAREIGSAPEPISAPNSTALIGAPTVCAAAAMSNRMARCASVSAAFRMRSEAKRPSAMADFSPIANTRLVEAIRVVRCGVT
jgi:hypothetical protein